MLKKNVLVGLILILFAGLAAADATQFKVRIENISQPDILKSSIGATASLGFSPGVYVLHTQTGPVFMTGRLDNGMGLESQSEDGDPTMLSKSINGTKGIISVGVFNTPVGKSSPGPIRPGDTYEFTFPAEKNSKAKLTIVMMWGQSNDLFYASSPDGITLFDKNGNPVSGEITSQFQLMDAGTEVNQEPGFGPDQGPRQSGPNTGPAEKKPVGALKDQYTYPEISKVLRITITPQ
ncbi:spondin domain-containing protein [bacterium]|nr:spondin domain-containing protein [bacterium]